MTDSSTSAPSSTDKNPDDTFKILLATDIHLGYAEKNEILSEKRKNIFLFTNFRNFVKFTADDTFNTFEEILEIAHSRDVDLILLGGDLFHDANPSSNSLYK